MVSRPQVHGDVGYVSVIEQDAASLGHSEAHDHMEAGGLTGAVRPQESDHLALRDLEVYAVDDAAPAIGLSEVPGGQSVVLRSHSRGYQLVSRLAAPKAKLFYRGSRHCGPLAITLYQNTVFIAEEREQIPASSATLHVIDLGQLPGCAVKHKLLIICGVDQPLAGGAPARLHQENITAGDSMIDLAGAGVLLRGRRSGRRRTRLRRLEKDIEVARGQPALIAGHHHVVLVVRLALIIHVSKVHSADVYRALLALRVSLHEFRGYGARDAPLGGQDALLALQVNAWRFQNVGILP